MIKSRRMRWVGHIACIAEKRNVCKIVVGKPQTNRPLENLDAGGRIILKYIYVYIEDGVVWTEFIWLMIGSSGGLV
jgi:hypothetical protein